MIYGPRGEVVSGGEAAEATRRMLQLMHGKLLKGFCKPNKLQEEMMLNDLRKSCGVEPKGGKTIRFRRYGGKECEE
ncbi:hypothetical protein KAR91_45430 [Candidatus Pacearchaeota archaeon]|nr:hypothetical protein [Candidatus Pacearchaeota archaeon]